MERVLTFPNVFEPSYRNEHCFAEKQNRCGYYFHNVDIIAFFLNSSKCHQAMQGVSLCPEGMTLVKNEIVLLTDWRL